MKIKTRLFHGVPTFAQLDEIYTNCAVDNEKVKVIYNDGYYLLQRYGKSMIRKCIM
uniref:Uncharacterized protein n=1 Tax=Vibrio phage P018-4 TaxID=3229728 RepID=A0AB39AJF4_9CAUD